MSNRPRGTDHVTGSVRHYDCCVVSQLYGLHYVYGAAVMAITFASRRKLTTGVVFSDTGARAFMHARLYGRLQLYVSDIR